MNEPACCACLHVNYTKYDHKDGTTSGWWECPECHSKFMPVRAYEHVTAELTKRLARQAITIGEHQDELRRKNEEVQQLRSALESGIIVDAVPFKQLS